MAVVAEVSTVISDIDNKITAAKVALVLAETAYKNTESGSAKEVVAELSYVAAQLALEELNSERDQKQSELDAARRRYSQLQE